MAPITQLSPSPIRMILMGNSGSGKSGALASLATAGYNLRIIDCENSSHILYNLLTDKNSEYVKANPGVAAHVSIVKEQDTYASKGQSLVCTKATAWTSIAKLLKEWKDSGDGWEENFGDVNTWTGKEILVVDSITALSTAAFNYVCSLNAKLGQTLEGFERQRFIGASQDLLRDFFRLVTHADLKCHVIVISHITFVTDNGGAPRQGQENASDTATAQGFPSALGRALSPHIPRFFNDMLVAKEVGVGQSVKRQIFTTPQIINSHIVSAKSSAPNKTKGSYALENGLAQYFEDIFGKVGK